MLGSWVGGRHLDNLTCLLGCLTRKPIERLRDRGRNLQSATCLRVYCWFPHSVLCPGTIRPLLPPVAIPWPEALGGWKPSFRLLSGELIFCFLSTPLVSQNLGLSVFRHNSTRRTRSHLFPPQVRRMGSLHLPTADTRMLGLWW